MDRRGFKVIDANGQSLEASHWDVLHERFPPTLRINHFEAYADGEI
jgi:hypothetical protein